MLQWFDSNKNESSLIHFKCNFLNHFWIKLPFSYVHMKAENLRILKLNLRLTSGEHQISIWAWHCWTLNLSNSNNTICTFLWWWCYNLQFYTSLWHQILKSIHLVGLRSIDCLLSSLLAEGRTDSVSIWKGLYGAALAPGSPAVNGAQTGHLWCNS